MEPLIFDRTLEDCQNVNRGGVETKGAYNAKDLNRVNEWVNFISAALAQYGYGYPMAQKTNWQAQDDIRVADWNAYLQGVKNIKEMLDLTQITLPVQINALMALNGHLRANDIEQLLFETENITKNLSKSRMSNEFNVGEM